MTTPPPPAAGVRLPWDRLPPRIPAALEAWAGSRIEHVAMQVGGFSPGVAARVRFANGHQIFVKAVSPELNPDTPNICRREAEVVNQLPAAVPAPRVLWVYDEGTDGWIMLVFEDVDGWTPAIPWKLEELDRVIDFMAELSALLTPAPIEAPSASDDFAHNIRGWIWMKDAPPDDLDPWAIAHMNELVEIESRAPRASRGNTLLHFDLRGDNILLTPDRTYAVDWSNVCIGASWVDLVCALPCFAMQGAPPPDALLQRHPAARDADPDDITAVLVSVAGLFLHRATLPPPPGLPTLRPFQQGQGVAALHWLRERLGD